MENFQQQIMERLIRLLDQEIRSRGQGSIAKVDRAAGFQRGWWQNRVKSGVLSVKHLLQVLDHLGLDPVKFVRQSFGRKGTLELDRPRGATPELVTRIEWRFRKREEGRGVGLKWIETLDELRRDSPKEVLRAAEWHVDHIELKLMPQFLGVVGSAWRLMISLDKSEHSLHAGLRIAEAQKAYSTSGDLLQRLSYVVADRGEYWESLRLSKEAMINFLHTNDSPGMARSMVDQGIWLSRLEQSEAAIGTMQSALELLPAEERENRFTAFQVIGLQLCELDRLDEAIEYVSRAEKECPGLNPWAIGKLSWLKATVSIAMKRWGEAERLLEEVVATFEPLHLGEAALATCDQVKTQLLQGKHQEAFANATRICALLESLQENEILGAAIADLLRCGKSGLTLALVERVSYLVKDERQQLQNWSMLAVRKNSL